MKSKCKILIEFLLGLLLVMFIVGCDGVFETEEAKEGSKENPIILTVNKWKDGEIVQKDKNGSGEQWFSFTATASLQNIYIKFGSLKSLYVSLYDSEYIQVGEEEIFEGNGGQVKYIDRAFIKDAIYYIKVSESDSWRTSERSGTYQIGFTKFPAQPETVITELNSDVWTNGEIVQKDKNGSGEQWFSFTATASLQNIYIKFRSLKSLYVSLYDSEYIQVGEEEIFEGNGGQVKYIDISTNKDNIYYIKVSESDGWRTSERSGTYQIAFNSTGEEPM